MTDPTIVTLGKDRVRPAADTLTAAFMSDPAFAQVLPDPAHRRLGLHAILTVALADTTAAGQARAVERDGRPIAVAQWQPPGRYPMDRRRQLRAVPRMLALGVRIGSRVRTLAQLGQAIDDRFPSDPVWYLQALGVHPDHQGTGLGGALLREGMQRADADGIDTYLETGKPDNVGYYQRVGFDVVDAPDEIFPGGPPMWMMRRPAHPPA